MIEIDHDPERSPCGIHLFTTARVFCPICAPALIGHPAIAHACEHDGRSSPAARERARDRGQARAAADPSWGQTWTPTAIGAGD